MTALWFVLFAEYPSSYSLELIVIMLATTFSLLVHSQSVTVMFCHVDVVCTEGKGLPEKLV